MKTSDFYFDLPEELIAQHPSDRRDGSTILFCDATQKTTSNAPHFKFDTLPDILCSSFALTPQKPLLLILNNAKVVPARIPVIRKSGSLGEVFLLDFEGESSLRCLLRPLKKMQVGDTLFSAKSGADRVPLFRIVAVGQEPKVECVFPSGLGALMETFGKMPIPPYIFRDVNQSLEDISEDKKRYQTVYAKNLGSCAAPTAGLHFTQKTFEDCAKNHVNVRHVTLNVGLGTFLPVKSEMIENHEMHKESFMLPKETLESIFLHLENHWPIVFVGTTSLRCVEGFFKQVLKPHLEKQNSDKNNFNDFILAKRDSIMNHADEWLETQIFIYPKHELDIFRPIIGDGLLTNFHQPGSTLAMLVASLLGFDFWKVSYQKAIDDRFRFLSYGDACFIKWGSN